MIPELNAKKPGNAIAAFFRDMGGYIFRLFESGSIPEKIKRLDE